MLAVLLLVSGATAAPGLRECPAEAQGSTEKIPGRNCARLISGPLQIDLKNCLEIHGNLCSITVSNEDGLKYFDKGVIGTAGGQWTDKRSDWKDFDANFSYKRYSDIAVDALKIDNVYGNGYVDVETYSTRQCASNSSSSSAAKSKAPPPRASWNFAVQNVPPPPGLPHPSLHKGQVVRCRWDRECPPTWKCIKFGHEYGWCFEPGPAQAAAPHASAQQQSAVTNQEADAKS